MDYDAYCWVTENCSLVDFGLRGCSARVRLQAFGGVEHFEEVLLEELCLDYRAYYREIEDCSLVGFVLRGCSAMFRPYVFVGLGDFGNVL